jgi:hypothetical protein
VTAPYEPGRTVAHAPGVPGRAPARKLWGPVVWSPGLILGALGALCVLVSLFLPWRDPSVYPSDVPLAFLWDKTTKAHDPSLLLVLIPIAIILMVGAVSPLGRGLRGFGGFATLVVTGLFAYQLSELVGLAHNGTNVGDLLSTGFYLAAVGGLFSLASSFVRSAPFARGRGYPGTAEATY